MLSTLLFRLKSYLCYFFKAKNSNYLHSPFIFGLYNQLQESIREPELEVIHKYRKFLKEKEQPISLKEKDGTIFTISIALRYKKTSISSQYGKILRGLQKYIQAKNILELGTSLGVSSLYLSSESAKVATIDINDIGEKMVKEFFNSNSKNYKLPYFHIGDFKSILPIYLEQNEDIDFVFIDGDHTYTSTIDNTLKIIPNLSQNSCIVLDDIRWNYDMYRAWEELKSKSIFNYTIDIGRIGILMKINNHSPKQHFTLHL